MVTSFGCSCVDGLGATQGPSHWRSCKVLGKMGEGGIDDRDIAIEVEGAWNLGGMGMLSCIRAGLMPLPPLLFDRRLQNIKFEMSVLLGNNHESPRQSILLFNRPLKCVR